MSDEVDRFAVDHAPPEQGQTRRAFLTGTVAASGVVTGLRCLSAATGAEPTKGSAPVNPRLFTFVGGIVGKWEVITAKAVVGDPLPAVKRLDIVGGAVLPLPGGAKWALRGITSNERYVTRAEKEVLVKKQAALGRPEATHAALSQSARARSGGV